MEKNVSARVNWAASAGFRMGMVGKTERWRSRVHSLLQVGWRPDKSCWPWGCKGITCGGVFMRWGEHTHAHSRTHAISYTMSAYSWVYRLNLNETWWGWHTHTHTHTHTCKHSGEISNRWGSPTIFQSIAIAMLLTVALLLPFHIHVRQLPQMEFSAYLRKDSSKWHCPVADDYHVCNNKLRSFSFPLLHKHSHTYCTHTYTHTCSLTHTAQCIFVLWRHSCPALCCVFNEFYRLCLCLSCVFWNILVLIATVTVQCLL